MEFPNLVNFSSTISFVIGFESAISGFGPFVSTMLFSSLNFISIGLSFFIIVSISIGIFFSS